MKLLKIISTYFLILIMLLSLTGSAFGVNEVRKTDDIRMSDAFTNEQLKEILDNTQPTKSEYFKELKQDENVITFSGEIPAIKGEEAYDWWISMQKVARLIQADSSFQKYLLEHGGVVSGFGVSVYGYMTVYVHPEMKDSFSKKDLENIQLIIEQYAAKEGITNFPLIFYYSDLNFELDAGFSTKVRPILGGYEVTGEELGSGLYMNGTIGFPAVRNNNSSKGFITASHLIPYNTNSTIYQPGPLVASSSIGTVKDTKSRIDALFVPFNNVEPIINVGNDTVLSSRSRTNENETHMIVYGNSGASSGMNLNRYGGVTNNSEGLLIEYIYNRTLNNYSKSIDTLGVMQTTQGLNGVKGDSGGPVYVGMNVTITTGKTTSRDYQAIAIGTTCGHNNSYVGSIPVVFYAPISEIDYYLDVNPYYVRNRVLT
jgi:hypothetical protein